MRLRYFRFLIKIFFNVKDHTNFLGHLGQEDNFLIDRVRRNASKFVCNDIIVYIGLLYNLQYLHKIYPRRENIQSIDKNRGERKGTNVHYGFIHLNHSRSGRYTDMIRKKDQYFNLCRILLLTIGLWPYQQSNFVTFQYISISTLLITFVIFQVRKYHITNIITFQKNKYTLCKIYSFYYIFIHLLLCCAMVFILNILQLLLIKYISQVQLYVLLTADNIFYVKLYFGTFYEDFVFHIFLYVFHNKILRVPF